MWTLNQRKYREKQYRSLVHPHVAHLLQIAIQRTGSPGVVEDLVQESCIAAWEGLNGLKSSQAARPWLVRILLRRIADHTRTHKRQQGLLPITDLEEQHWQTIASEDLGPLEHALAEQADERIAQLLRDLPRDFAIAVELHDIMGYRYQEIAEILEVPLGTVMSRLSRGRRLLAVVLRAARDGGQENAPQRPTTQGDRHG